MADGPHVRLVVRCRPPPATCPPGPRVTLDLLGTRLTVAAAGRSPKTLRCDALFHEHAHQGDIFESVGQEMVDRCLEGINTCCIAYGAAGTGKTHAVVGTEGDPGLLRRVAARLFEGEGSHDVRAASWEVIGDAVFDTLAVPGDGTPAPTLRRHPVLGTHDVVGLQEVPVASLAALDGCLTAARSRSKQLAAKRQGLASHAFLRLRLTRRREDDPGRVAVAWMLFCDLKGAVPATERRASVQEMRHTAAIARDTALLNAALVQLAGSPGSSIAGAAGFGACVLTRLLAEPLSGRCATTVLATVCALDVPETIGTLEALQPVRRVALRLAPLSDLTPAGRARKGLERARAQLRVSTPPSTDGGPRPLTEAEEEVARLEHAYLSLTGTDPGGDNGMPAPSSPGSAAGSGIAVFFPTTKGTRTYKGHWSGAAREGEGEQTTDTVRYRGQWRNNRRHGTGTLWERKPPAGAWVRVYRGEWSEGRRHGPGTQWYPNGDLYEGDWARGQRAGTGTLYFASGDRLTGDWAADRVEGTAVLHCHNGDRFEGEWRAGVREGPGVWLFRSKGQRYRGDWHNGTAVCGTVEDLPERAVGPPLPRCGLLRPGAVLEDAHRLMALRRAAAPTPTQGTPQEEDDDLEPGDPSGDGPRGDGESGASA